MMMIMFTKISWSTYIITVAGALFVYYGFVILKYYSFELQKFFQTKGKPSPRASEKYNETTIPAHTTPIEESADETMERVEQFISKVKSLISESFKIRESKNDFMENLKPILWEFGDLKDSAFHAALVELTVSECAKYGAITLSEMEVERVWNDEV
jgi:hypothetical protein